MRVIAIVITITIGITVTVTITITIYHYHYHYHYHYYPNVQFVGLLWHFELEEPSICEINISLKSSRAPLFHTSLSPMECFFLSESHRGLIFRDVISEQRYLCHLIFVISCRVRKTLQNTIRCLYY